MKGRKTGGRKRGVPNKLTASVKEAIIAAFDDAGGQKYLLGVARENPAVFCQLLGKIIPLQLTGDADNPIAVSVVERVIVDPKAAD